MDEEKQAKKTWSVKTLVFCKLCLFFHVCKLAWHHSGIYDLRVAHTYVYIQVNYGAGVPEYFEYWVNIVSACKASIRLCVSDEGSNKS